MSGALFQNAGRIGLTLAAGAATGALFHLAHLPAPWLSGGMVGMVVLLVLGIRPLVPVPLRNGGLLMAGIVTGSAVTPDMLRTAARYPVSMLLLALTTWAITVSGRVLLSRGFGWNRRDAFLAAVPGALSAVIATSAATGADMARIVAVQAFRVFVLIALLPSAVMLARPEIALPAEKYIDAYGFLLVFAASFAFSLLFNRLRVIAPYLFGGMAATAALYVTGYAQGGVPPLLSAVAMLLVGVFGGSRFADLDLDTLKRLLLPSLLVLALSTLLAIAGGMAAAWLADISLAAALVAFAPGGLEAMVLLGLAMGLDPLYVSSHHVARFMMIALVVPFAARRFGK